MSEQEIENKPEPKPVRDVEIILLRSGACKHRCRKCGSYVIFPDANRTWDVDCCGPGTAKGKAREKTKEPAKPPCIHLLAATGELVSCSTCNGNVRLKVRGCAIHGNCLPGVKESGKTEPDVRKCDGCGDYSPSPGG